MGKQGPCYHCGVTSTPLWRNGPPEKPVLCNACGSRWRTKGTLSNYTPLHSRADADEYEDQRVSKVKSISFKVGGEKLKKRKLSYEKTTDEDTSNRSSSGSALSNSDSFTQLRSADASDFTGPSRSAVWENQVPSKKRSLITRTKSSSSSPVEKLIKDLHAILHEQKSSYLSLYSEEDLLFESDAPMVSVEIGHGSVLIKHPSWLVREEDSEASSLSFENKPCASNEAYSHPAKVMQQEPDRMQHFLTQDSSLCYIDLNDVVNFEVLMGHFTSEERQQLLEHLLPDDTSELPGSLRDMFDSSCFKESLSFFQQLVSDGVFSNGCSGAKAEDLKTLKKLVVSDSTKSEWLELYSKLKDSREIEDESGSKLGLTKDLQCAKRPLQEQNLNMPSKETTEGPKRGLTTKLGLGSLFRLPTDSCCSKLDSCEDEYSDQDLLLDVPSYGSFPEAELLLQPSSISQSQKTSASSSSIHPTMIHH